MSSVSQVYELDDDIQLTWNLYIAPSPPSRPDPNIVFPSSPPLSGSLSLVVARAASWEPREQAQHRSQQFFFNLFFQICLPKNDNYLPNLLCAVKQYMITSVCLSVCPFLSCMQVWGRVLRGEVFSSPLCGRLHTSWSESPTLTLYSVHSQLLNIRHLIVHQEKVPN